MHIPEVPLSEYAILLDQVSMVGYIWVKIMSKMEIYSEASMVVDGEIMPSL